MSRFREIEGYDGYTVYDDGRIYSLKTNKFLSYRVNQSGYRYVNLCKNGKYKSVSIHRLVGKYFVDNPNNYNCLNHIDCDKQNNLYSNLEWCTIKHNCVYASKNGLLKIRKGEDSNLSVLTKKEVDCIRELYNNTDLSMKNIADLYGVTKSNIYQIVKNIIWHDENYILDKNVLYNKKNRII